MHGSAVPVDIAFSKLISFSDCVTEETDGVKATDPGRYQPALGESKHAIAVRQVQ
jgi:hypothetical protein